MALGVHLPDWTNPCGGARWRTLPNGAIEVEGEGVPVWPEGSPQRRYLEQTWRNWKPYFEEAAAKFDLPPAWALAIATQETGLWSADPARQARIESQDGYSSIGIMQPIPSAATSLGYHPNDRYDPRLNIEMGTAFLAKYLDGDGFPRLAAKFNAGPARGCRPGNDRFNLPGHQGKYVDHAIRYLNSAVVMGLASSRASSALPVGAVLGVFALSVLGGVMVYRRLAT